MLKDPGNQLLEGISRLRGYLKRYDPDVINNSQKKDVKKT